MKVFDLSGMEGPNDDFFRFSIAMEPGRQSQLQIYESGGNGVFEYSTMSDYIYSVKRLSMMSGTVVNLKSSEANRTGYPSEVSWVPGPGLTSLSNHYKDTYSPRSSTPPPSGVEPGESEFPVNVIPPLTPKSELSDLQYIKSGIYIPSDHYDNPWSPDYLIEVSNITSADQTLPFIEVKNNNIQTTGVINIFSASEEGSIVTFDITKSYSSGDKNLDRRFQSRQPKKIGPALSSSTTKNAMLAEWNSIFRINDNCNAGSVFRSGENRDEVWWSTISRYIQNNWYGKMRNHLWGNCLDDSSVELSTRDPKILKNMVLYQFFYFGASNDIYAMGKKNFTEIPGNQARQATQIRWFIGVDGESPLSDAVRKLGLYNSYFPPIGDYKRAFRVTELPPRPSFGYITQNNENLSSFSGSYGASDGAGDGSSIYY